MTFQGGRILFTELFGPLVGLKENWEEQHATPEELDFSAFRYRLPASYEVPVQNGRRPGTWTQIFEDEQIIRWIDDLGRTMELQKGFATIPLPLD